METNDYQQQLGKTTSSRHLNLNHELRIWWAAQEAKQNSNPKNNLLEVKDGRAPEREDDS